MPVSYDKLWKLLIGEIPLDKCSLDISGKMWYTDENALNGESQCQSAMISYGNY